MVYTSASLIVERVQIDEPQEEQRATLTRLRSLFEGLNNSSCFDGISLSNAEFISKACSNDKTIMFTLWSTISLYTNE
jgi:hypothetical protein